MSRRVVSRALMALAVVAALGSAHAVSADGPVEPVEWSEPADEGPEHLHVLRFLAPAARQSAESELAHTGLHCCHPVLTIPQK